MDRVVEKDGRGFSVGYVIYEMCISRLDGELKRLLNIYIWNLGERMG